jgi:hypothetical protein
MLTLLIRSLSGCYSVDAIPTSAFSLAENTCFAFNFTSANLPHFSGKNVTVSIGLDTENTFFGLSRGSSLPDFLIVEHSVLPPAGEIDYDAFKEPIPVLCSPIVAATDVRRLVHAEGITTEDGREVAFGVRFVSESPAYLSHFQAAGNCIELTRRIPALEVEGVSTGECVGMVLGLVLGTGLIAGCIIFLTPFVKAQEEGEPGDGDSLVAKSRVDNAGPEVEDGPSEVGTKSGGEDEDGQ